MALWYHCPPLEVHEGPHKESVQEPPGVLGSGDLITLVASSPPPVLAGNQAHVDTSAPLNAPYSEICP